MSKPSSSFAQPAKKTSTASAKPGSGGGGQRRPLKQKHLVLGVGAMAAGLVALWPFLMGSSPTTAPVAVSAPAAAVATPAPGLAVAGNAIPAPAMQTAPADGGAAVPVAAADWKHGWITSAHSRDGGYDLLQVTQPPFARWLDPESAHLSTDHLATIPTRNPFAPAGQMREAFVEFAKAQDRTLTLYLYPTRTLTAQRCAARITVNGVPVIEQAGIPIAAGAQAPVALVSTPFATDGGKTKVAWWTQCQRVDDRGQPAAVEWANHFGAAGRLAEAAAQPTDPQALLGVEWRLLTSDAAGVMPKLLPADLVWHDAKDEPKITKANRGTIRTGGTGDPLPAGVKSGWRVEAIPYGQDWMKDIPGQPVARTFEVKGSVFGSKDHYLGDTVGGPFVYRARATMKVKDAGLWQILVAARTPDRRPDFLHCAASLDLGGLPVINSATATSTALGGSGLISGLAKLDPGTVDADLRLACKPAGDRGYALTPDGLFAPGEAGATFALYVKGPTDDAFRTPRTDEFTFKAK